MLVPPGTFTSDDNAPKGGLNVVPGKVSEPIEALENKLELS